MTTEANAPDEGKKRLKKTLFATGLGGVAGFVVAFTFMQVVDAGSLGELGTSREIAALGLARAEDIVDGCVVRMPKAYPVYDSEYHDAMATLRQFFDGFENLQLVGRNGMHRYNNQDHSMLTAMLAVKNIQGARFDLWKVNEEDSYHEELTDREADALTRDLALLNQSQPQVPTRVAVST